jgi:dTDP-4-amino-4,6-dideoxygalactose transaminase
MISSDDMPAILGGAAVRPQGPPDWPFPDPEILQALQAAYQDGSWGKYHGHFVPRLEQRLAQYHGVEFVATCGSGTFAVELALRALKIQPGDEVIQSAYDYGGNFLSIHAVGATPVLVDVRPDNWNLDPEPLQAAIGPKTRAVIVSHLHGGIVPMREIMTIAAERGLSVIEDSAQMPGAVIQGRKAGTWGDVGILSFGGSKLLTAGRGGAMLTQKADIYQRARLWLNRGNQVCPLSELQAAVLLPQLDQLDAQNGLRAKNVRLLVERLQDYEVGLRPFTNHCPDSEPGYYKLGFQFNSAGFAGLSRERFMAAVRAEGMAVDEGFHSLHVGRAPSRFRNVGDLAEATQAHEGTIVLHHPVLLSTSRDIEEIALAIGKVHRHAERLRTQSPTGT